jgi:hypothetical protein
LDGHVENKRKIIHMLLQKYGSSMHEYVGIWLKEKYKSIKFDKNCYLRCPSLRLVFN